MRSRRRLERIVIGAEGAEARRPWQALKLETARHREGGAPPMGVSFHRAVRRFEGRESATTDLAHF
jgi:hypothetical protein